LPLQARLKDRNIVLYIFWSSLEKGWEIMTLNVDTIIAVSLMMAVFSAVAAVGTSIVLGVGFERLRAGFEIVSKQTGFFSDVINKLEKKVEKVDESTDSFSRSITTLEAKVGSVGEQASAFTQSIQKLERKVEIVDKQTAFFSDALHKLEEHVESIEVQEVVPAAEETVEEAELISTGKAEALVAHAEDLLGQVSMLAAQIQDHKSGEPGEASYAMPSNQFTQYLFAGGTKDKEEIRYH
jgi:septal ring factor EnvC (AmiA/AmiB activator)